VGAYRAKRNIQTSTKDFLKAQLSSAWSGVTVVNAWPETGLQLPVVAILMGANEHEGIEIGSTSTVREVQLFVHIFAQGEDNRMDLSDFIVEKLKKPYDYYTYTVTAGVSSRVLSGKIIPIRVSDREINFNIDKLELAKIDRHRHLVDLTVRTNIVEG